MAPQRDWTPAQWYQEAVRCYVDGHQGCPWCLGSHRVFRSEREGRLDYYCNCCEFYASHETKANAYRFVPGQCHPTASMSPAVGCP